MTSDRLASGAANNSADFLLELLSEEIPARMQSKARNDLARMFAEQLAAEGIDISHAKALELVARQQGARDWNTLAARPVATKTETTTAGAPFGVGENVSGTFNGNPAQGRVIGIEETIKPDLWRVTVAFDPPVDVSTSKLFSSQRRRIQMVVGADGRSRHLTGTETGVMVLGRA